MVVRIAKSLVEAGVRPGEIGIITPYAAQAHIIAQVCCGDRRRAGVR